MANTACRAGLAEPLPFFHGEAAGAGQTPGGTSVSVSGRPLRGAKATTGADPLTTVTGVSEKVSPIALEPSAGGGCVCPVLSRLAEREWRVTPTLPQVDGHHDACLPATLGVRQRSSGRRHRRPAFPRAAAGPVEPNCTRVREAG